MTVSRYIYNTLDINMAILRFWGDKPQVLLDILHYDTPHGWYVFEGKHTDALSTGFDIVDEDDEILEVYEQMDPEVIDDLMEKYAKGRAEANKSYAIIGFFDFGEGETFYFLTDTHITELEIKPGTKEITKLKFNNPLEEPGKRGEPIEVTSKGLDKVRLLGEYDKRIGRFRSKYESIIDNLTALSILDQQLTLLIIRTGSGIRYIIASDSILQDEQARNELEDTLENWGLNTMFIVPQGGDEDNFQVHLDFGDGSPPIDWSISRSNLLRGLSIRLGIPEEVFNGAELGLRSSEKNHGKYLNSMYRDQKDMAADIKWIIEWQMIIDGIITSEPMEETDEENEEETTQEIGLPSTSRVKFRPFVEPDEETMIEMFMNKMEALDKAISISEKTGMPLDFIKQELKLDYETDEAMIQQFNERKEEMLNTRVTEGNVDEEEGNEQPPNQPSQTDEQEE